MKTSQMFPSKFMKVGDIPKTGLAVTIKAVKPGTVMDRATGEVKRVYTLSFVEPEHKPLTLNKTNAEIITAWYGDETDDWIGKPLTLVRVRADVFGKTKLVIRVEPPEDEDEKNDIESEDPEPGEPSLGEEEIPF